MEVILEQVSKRFDQQYILKNINKTICAGSTCGIRGINGSGKSTLCGIISGLVLPTKGKVHHLISGQDQDLASNTHKFLSSTGPYHQLPEFLSCEQILDITVEKKMDNKFSKTEFWTFLEFKTHQKKLFHELSSGMQQRFKLALTLYAEAALYIFDEPTNFLDDYWKIKLSEKLSARLKGKTVIIASNVEGDFKSCDDYIYLEGET
ncbi:MAG TPA: ATP-binding cassette domain-containing protein [Saprospiraceae bacterium]|nr:ATP-binding cassette domain-containing protein [Saprospiraceae bacterium]